MPGSGPRLVATASRLKGNVSAHMVQGRVVIVTGAANGIGRALAAGFHADGFTVVGVDSDAGRLTAMASASQSYQRHSRAPYRGIYCNAVLE